MIISEIFLHVITEYGYGDKWLCILTLISQGGGEGEVAVFLCQKIPNPPANNKSTSDQAVNPRVSLVDQKKKKLRTQ